MKENHKIVDERRRLKRFKVKHESVFVVTSYGPTLGKVIDISEGGLAFTYASEKKWPSDLSEAYMVFGNHDTCLDMPMRIVSDYVCDTGGKARGPTVRRRSMKFDDMSNEQRHLLECFISINGVV